jgi:DNA-binding transcriptional ArsR family regulator
LLSGQPFSSFGAEEPAPGSDYHDGATRQLDLAPAAVYAHLSRLKDAGLVEPHRNGKRVYYRLSYARESLLEIFGESG